MFGFKNRNLLEDITNINEGLNAYYTYGMRKDAREYVENYSYDQNVEELRQDFVTKDINQFKFSAGYQDDVLQFANQYILVPNGMAQEVYDTILEAIGK